MTWALYDVLGFTATGIDNTDQEPMGMSTMVTNMTAAAHTVDLDGSVDATTSTPRPFVGCSLGSAPNLHLHPLSLPS